MARGETLGQRRRRKRRERHGGDPAFDPHPPVTSPRRLAEAEERALADRPAWVKAIWATPHTERAHPVETLPPKAHGSQPSPRLPAARGGYAAGMARPGADR